MSSRSGTSGGIEGEAFFLFHGEALRRQFCLEVKDWLDSHAKLRHDTLAAHIKQMLGDHDGAEDAYRRSVAAHEALSLKIQTLGITWKNATSNWHA